MNIEEERKAFAEHYKVAARGAYDEPDLYFKDGEFCCAVTQRSFDTWLAAKAHADSDIKMLLRVCAFESIEHARKWDVDKECQHVTTVTESQFFDDGFAKGMAHAAEMAKPVVSIQTSFHSEWFAYKSAFYGPCFSIKSNAVQWAKDNGYRVIE